MNKYYLLLRPPGKPYESYSDITFEQCQAILRSQSHPIPILADALVPEGFLITVKTDGGIYSIWMTPVPPLDLSLPTKRLYVDWLRLNFAFLHQAVTRLGSFQAVRLFDVRPSEVRFVWHGAENRGAYLDQPYTQRPISDWIRGFAALRYRYDQFQRRDLIRWRKDLTASGIYCAVWFDPVYKEERFYVGRMTKLNSRWNPGKTKKLQATGSKVLWGSFSNKTGTIVALPEFGCLHLTLGEG
jgi:hypothetical protein